MIDDESSPANEPSLFERFLHAISGAPKDKQSFVTFLREAKDRGFIDAESMNMIEGVLSVSEMQVRDIMVPRAKMTVIERDQPFEEVLAVVIESGHSRFPLVGDDKDDVLGILLAKDLLHYRDAGITKLNLKEIMRPVTFVPESKRLNILLKEFRVKKNHMAIVVDEYGGVSGLITIEDVLEEIVGEIGDEFDIEDDEEASIIAHSDDTYNVKALTPIEEFNSYFGCSFSDADFDTIGGLVTNAFGHLPNRDETITIGDYEFTILLSDARRIRVLGVRPLKEMPREESNTATVE
jgi:magnesium and cobalt transporter